MSEYGALPTGFRRKRLDEIFSELCEYFKGTIGVDRRNTRSRFSRSSSSPLPISRNSCGKKSRMCTTSFIPAALTG